MSDELVIRNARIVLRDRVVTGSLRATAGAIAAVDEETAAPPARGTAIDFEGDYLLPGLVELHTDNLEKHFMPRPGVTWPASSAVLAHDAEIAASGITTVLDGLRVGSLAGDRDLPENVAVLSDAIESVRERGLLRADHLVHLRCEVSSPNVLDDLERHLPNPAVRLISIMDHTPGQRQFADESKYRFYYQKKHGLSDAEMDRFMAEQREAQQRYGLPNRERIVALGRDRGIPLASHDDATRDHALEAFENGMTIAEFPTSLEAATASRACGLKVLMGAPNVVRGGSHSGNISALALAQRGLLDILSSDYVPCSLLMAAFLLRDQVAGMDLPAAIGLVSHEPAAAAGLHDRGEIAVGRRADLVRVAVSAGHPVARSVWREGVRVA